MVNLFIIKKAGGWATKICSKTVVLHQQNLLQNLEKPAHPD